MPVAIVIGASRGLGADTALALARKGYDVCVAAKTAARHPTLPGTIHTVAEQVRQAGVKGIPIACDVRKEADISSAFLQCRKELGSVDLVVYNAGAVHWGTLQQTPVKKFDLLHQVNSRGFYNVVQNVLPIFEEQGSGRIIAVCPPIYSRFVQGKVAYSMSKLSMSLLVLGLAQEWGKQVEQADPIAPLTFSVCGLWPATAVESFVTEKIGVPKALMRQGAIFADAMCHIATLPHCVINGRLLIDEDILREGGATDFAQYRADPLKEPPRMMPRAFPSLRVAEEEEAGAQRSKAKL